MREPSPPSGVPASADPAQLQLGGLEPGSAGGSAVVDFPPRGTDEHELPVAVREPPVCGEWSFDTGDVPEARLGATFVTPTPAAAMAVVPGSDAVGRPTPPLLVPPPPMPRSPARSITPQTPLPALDELKSIHDAHPADERTAQSLANALAKRGNIEGALGVLQRAIDAGADGVELRCAKATILSGRLRYDEAEAELRRAAKLKVDDKTVLLQQGILACRRAKWREAVEPLARVARLDPASGAGHFYLGEAYSKLDRLGEALESYHRAAEIEPDNWRALKGVGMLLDRMGRPGEAAEFYRRARDAQSG